MLRLIGDVHGKIGQYVDQIKHTNHSLQLGDMGFKDSYRKMRILFERYGLSFDDHKFVMGNHDDRDHVPANALETFGVEKLGGIEFFYVAGAYSVDHIHRIPGYSIWENEQLNTEQGNLAVEMYELLKPDLVVSHDCPSSIVPMVMTNDWKLNGSWTGNILQEMFSIHKPKRWIFGHHHNTKTFVNKGTEFTCLGELDHMLITDCETSING